MPNPFNFVGGEEIKKHGNANHCQVSFLELFHMLDPRVMLGDRNLRQVNYTENLLLERGGVIL